METIPDGKHHSKSLILLQELQDYFCSKLDFVSDLVLYQVQEASDRMRVLNTGQAITTKEMWRENSVTIEGGVDEGGVLGNFYWLKVFSRDIDRVISRLIVQGVRSSVNDKTPGGWTGREHLDTFRGIPDILTGGRMIVPCNFKPIGIGVKVDD